MIAVAVIAGRRSGILVFQQSFSMNRGGEIIILVDRQTIAGHVFGIGMAGRAGTGQVESVDRRVRHGGFLDVVNRVAGYAVGDFAVAAAKEALAMF